MLAQKIALETHEFRELAVANRFQCRSLAEARRGRLCPAWTLLRGGLNDLFRRVVFKHRRQRDIQCFAYHEKTRRADAVLTTFVFLNLLERDTQFLAQPLLAHFKHKHLLAHPSADVSVDGACASRRNFPFRLFLAAS
jgi:hypothetical protein